MDYERMGLPELEARQQELMREGQAILDEQHTIQSVIDTRLADRNAQVRLAAMTDTEKDALLRLAMQMARGR